MNTGAWKPRRRWARGMALLVLGVAMASGCARLPITTSVVHEDSRVAVKLQREIEPAAYTHPIQLTPQDVSAILGGFSLREVQRLPVRWFAEEAPPKRVFREDELVTLSVYLVEALQKAGPEERVHFQLFMPGMNRVETRNVTSGWITVRDPYLYLTIEHFQVEVPLRKSDAYYRYNPLLEPLPGSYLLFFEPGRFWVMDQKGVRALDFRKFLKTAPISRTGEIPPPRVVAVP